MPPTREVIQAEALDWLDHHPAATDTSIITSLPDVSELGGLTLQAWREWFVAAAERVIRWVPDGGVSIFFQSDIRHSGVWVDKGYWVSRAAERADAHLLWHGIACRKPPGTAVLGRPTYSHLLCFQRGTVQAGRHAFPDVLPDVGWMSFSKAMGMKACELACRFLLQETRTRRVLDPFCGQGTVLAVANAMGLDAVGIDLSRRRCKNARRLVVNFDGKINVSPTTAHSALSTHARAAAGRSRSCDEETTRTETIARGPDRG